MAVTQTSALAAISESFPQFEGSSVAPLGEGMESVAFIVGGDHVFRFPKTDDARAGLRREISVLPRLRIVVSTPIPDFRFVGPDASFVGYPLIRGEMLSRGLFESLDEAAQERIFAQVARFLDEVHAFAPGAGEAAAMTRDMRAEYEESLEELRRLALPHLGAGEAGFAERAFAAYLGDEANFEYAPVLAHNDLSADHIFVDPASPGVIAGIIDFGDLAVTDGDYDLMYLLDDYGERFVRGVLRHQRREADERLFRKLYFWGLADILQLTAHHRENGAPDEAAALEPDLAGWIATMRARFAA